MIIPGSSGDFFKFEGSVAVDEIFIISVSWAIVGTSLDVESGSSTEAAWAFGDLSENFSVCDFFNEVWLGSGLGLEVGFKDGLEIDKILILILFLILLVLFVLLDRVDSVAGWLVRLWLGNKDLLFW